MIFCNIDYFVLFLCCSDSDEKLPQGVGKRKVSTVTFADEGARKANIPETILRWEIVTERDQNLSIHPHDFYHVLHQLGKNLEAKRIWLSSHLEDKRKGMKKTGDGTMMEMELNFSTIKMAPEIWAGPVQMIYTHLE